MASTTQEHDAPVEAPVAISTYRPSGGPAAPGPDRVLILGAGVAGLTAAYELRRRLGPRAAITVLADRGQFILPQGLLNVAFDGDSNKAGFAVEPALTHRGIAFKKARIERIEPARRMVVADGDAIPYDFLLVATGPEIDADAVPGIGGARNNAHFIHSEGTALATTDALEAFIHQPGHAVVGLATGASYLSAAYEFMLWLDYALRRRGTRQEATLTFVTPESHLGHLGMGTPGAQRFLERAFARRGIGVYPSTAITRVGSKCVVLASGQELNADFAMIMPAFRGTAGMWKTMGLTNRHGYVPVDEQYRHRLYPEIYAVGMAAQPAVAATANAGVPKTGYLAAAMAKAAARSIVATLTRTVPVTRPLPRLLDARIIDGGDCGMAMISVGRKHTIRVAVSLPGATAHRLKNILRCYLLWKLRTGRTYLP